MLYYIGGVQLNVLLYVMETGDLMNIRIFTKLTLILAFIFYIGCTSASNYTGKVAEILMGSPYGNNVIIKVDGSPTQTGCHTNPNFNYVFDGSIERGKIMLSALFIAYTSQKEVTFYGAGDSSCTLFGGIEDLQQFLLK